MSRGFACVGLDHPKSPLNVGSVLRAAHCYGAALVATTGRRYTRAPTDPAKAYKHIPLVRVEDLQDAVPFDCVPVAVDLVEGAKSLPAYSHPERAFYVFGPEDGTLGSRVLDWCRDVVYVPTDHCMNLAACVNVVLYDRMSKREQTTADVIFDRTERTELDRLRGVASELADAVVDTVDRSGDVDGYHCLACDGWGERVDGVDHEDGCSTRKIGGREFER